ncbi:hypothetical protein T492DRAFT_1149777 [Pavlovales sp. CCMP2436]|nr:hypothetical protein T492DRAFT_1149777 [Pavlovales sp. CCMP2436]
MFAKVTCLALVVSLPLNIYVTCLALGLRASLHRVRGDLRLALATLDEAFATVSTHQPHLPQGAEEGDGGLIVAGVHVGAQLWLGWRVLAAELLLTQRALGRCAEAVEVGTGEALRLGDSAAASRLRHVGALRAAATGEHARALQALCELADGAADAGVPALQHAELAVHAAELCLLAAAAEGTAGSATTENVARAIARAHSAAQTLDALAEEYMTLPPPHTQALRRKEKKKVNGGFVRRQAWPALEQPAYDESGGYTGAVDGSRAVLAVPALHNLYWPSTMMRLRAHLLLVRFSCLLRLWL